MDDPTLPGFLWDLFVCDLFETSVTIFFYGLYVNLFILAIYTLQRRRTYGRIWLLAVSWMLFVVGTLQTILRVMILTVLGRAVALLATHGQGELPTAEIIGLVRDRLGLELADNAVFAVNLYRCYLVWGYRVKPVLLPGILILATTAMAIVSLVEGSSSSDFLLLGGRLQITTTTTAYGLGLAANVLLMALTAGRIWWMRRTLTNIPGLHSSIDTRFSAVISIILESGSIYCFSAFSLAITLTTVGSNNNFYSVLVGIAHQAVNIAPTLTVVRVGLGPKLDGCSSGSQMVDLHPNLEVERFGVANMLGSA
ncbi:hypothetical protein B0H16DRAFT_1530363 [Mycena metata]|uniref:Uncharacterized protein n=1 Tax=Mycena metata TaxID=1033252 RepID=A0AAD7JFM3_9AGAR|nr:hypothetical protein B0H16DRAFT_1530363 [Mycena metata]